MILPIKYMDGTGEQPLVLLHGLGRNYQGWRNVREHLDISTFRVYIPDLLGFGDAPKPKGIQYSLANHAEAVIRTIESLGVEEVMVAGHSLGSLVAIEIAMRRPDMVKHLTLLGTPVFEQIPKRNKIKKLFKGENIYFTIYSYLRDNPDLVITGSTAAEDLLPHLHGMEIDKDTWHAFESSLTNSVIQTKSFRDIGNLQVPTTITVGLLDAYVDNGAAKRAARNNTDYVRVKPILGPHEITPYQGRKVSRIVKAAAKKYGKY